MRTDVCRIAGVESVLPDGICFPHEVAGESEIGGVMLVKGIGRGGFNNSVRMVRERERQSTYHKHRRNGQQRGGNGKLYTMEFWFTNSHHWAIFLLHIQLHTCRRRQRIRLLQSLDFARGQE